MKPLNSDILCSDKKIIEVSQHTHLGIVLYNNFSWRAHIFKIYDKASERLNILKGIKYKVDKTTLRKVYISLVSPLMEYADVLWDRCTESESDLLGHVQYEAAKIVTGAMKGVEGLNVINGPKCNKVLNVINSQAANYSNYSNKPRPQISAAFGGRGVNKRRGAYSSKYGTKRSCYGIKLRSQISAAFFGEKVNKRCILQNATKTE